METAREINKTVPSHEATGVSSAPSKRSPEKVGIQPTNRSKLPVLARSQTRTVVRPERSLVQGSPRAVLRPERAITPVGDRALIPLGPQIIEGTFRVVGSRAHSARSRPEPARTSQARAAAESRWKAAGAARGVGQRLGQTARETLGNGVEAFGGAFSSASQGQSQPSSFFEGLEKRRGQGWGLGAFGIAATGQPARQEITRPVPQASQETIRPFPQSREEASRPQRASLMRFLGAIFPARGAVTYVRARRVSRRRSRQSVDLSPLMGWPIFVSSWIFRQLDEDQDKKRRLAGAEEILATPATPLIIPDRTEPNAWSNAWPITAPIRRPQERSGLRRMTQGQAPEVMVNQGISRARRVPVSVQESRSIPEPGQPASPNVENPKEKRLVRLPRTSPRPRLFPVPERRLLGPGNRSSGPIRVDFSNLGRHRQAETVRSVHPVHPRPRSGRTQVYYAYGRPSESKARKEPLTEGAEDSRVSK